MADRILTAVRRVRPRRKPPRSHELVKQDVASALARYQALHGELYAHPESVKERAPQERDARLVRLRMEASQGAQALPAFTNPLVDEITGQGTVENVRDVLAFLEAVELTDNNSNPAAERGRWRLNQWLVDSLKHADAQMTRENEIHRAIVEALDRASTPS
jgi:hypothetical protein